MAGPRVVLDTNVIVSAALSSLRGREHSPSLLIFKQLAQESGDAPLLVLSDAILSEYSAVLSRRQFGIPLLVIHDVLTRIARSAVLIRPKSRLELVDREDNIFLECALDGLAEYLITGNKRHYPNWTIVVTPREFLSTRRP